ncbi:hypothetical protein [Kaarinaea lacus]
MRKLTEWLLIFALGWSAAWVFYQQPEPSTPLATPSATSNSVAPGTPELISSAPIPSKQHQNPLEKPQQLLAQNRIDDYMQYFLEARDRVSSQQLSQIKRLFSNHIDTLQRNQQYSLAIEALVQFLQYEYDDVHNLQKLAQLHILQQNYLAAINTLFQAKAYAYQAGTLAQLERTIRKTTSQYTKLLQQQKNSNSAS